MTSTLVLGGPTAAVKGYRSIHDLPCIDVQRLPMCTWISHVSLVHQLPVVGNCYTNGVHSFWHYVLTLVSCPAQPIRSSNRVVHLDGNMKHEPNTVRYRRPGA